MSSSRVDLFLTSFLVSFFFGSLRDKDGGAAEGVTVHDVVEIDGGSLLYGVGTVAVVPPFIFLDFFLEVLLLLTSSYKGGRLGYPHWHLIPLTDKCVGGIFLVIFSSCHFK